MSDRTALLAAIIREPDEDTPRLVYADFLEENGQPERAEFIRVQVELARHPCGLLAPGTVHFVAPSCRGCDQVAALRRRQMELLPPNPDCDGPLSAFYRHGTWKYQRGFVEKIIAITAANWLLCADAVLAEHPIRKVTLTTVPAVGFREYLAEEWPGIEFVLPPAVPEPVG